MFLFSLIAIGLCNETSNRIWNVDGVSADDVSDANLFTQQSMDLNNGSKIIRVFEVRRETKDECVPCSRFPLPLSSPRHTFSSEKLQNRKIMDLVRLLLKFDASKLLPERMGKVEKKKHPVEVNRSEIDSKRFAHFHSTPTDEFNVSK